MKENTKAIIVNLLFVFGCSIAIYWITLWILYLPVILGSALSVGFLMVSFFTLFKKTMAQRSLQDVYINSRPLEGEPKGIFARTKEANKLYPMYAEVDMIPSKAFIIAAAVIIGVMVYEYLPI